MEKLKNFTEKLGIKAREVIFAVGASVAAAALPIISVAASADDTATATGLSKYSNDITSTFSGMVDDIMPIAITVLGTGATVFGLFIAWKLARKALSTVAK